LSTSPFIIHTFIIPSIVLIMLKHRLHLSTLASKFNDEGSKFYLTFYQSGQHLHSDSILRCNVMIKSDMKLYDATAVSCNFVMHSMMI